MSTTDIVVIIIAVIVVAVFVAATARIVLGRRALKERFGDEYDRVVTDKGGRAAAEAELRQRERRHAELPLTELSPDAKAQFAQNWTDVQAEFVNDPGAAVHAADKLVSRIVADRGYPVVDYNDRLAHLSVEHAHVLNQYRDAHDVSVRNDAGHATTEELRQALVNYRSLVADLLGDPALNTTSSALTTPTGSLPTLTPATVAVGSDTGVAVSHTDIADPDAVMPEPSTPDSNTSTSRAVVDTDAADTSDVRAADVDADEDDLSSTDTTGSSATVVDPAETDTAPDTDLIADREPTLVPDTPQTSKENRR